MTEKRFTYWEEENGEFPFPYIKDSDGKSIVSLYECVECLNNLHEENMNNKAEITRFKLIVSDIVDDLEKQAKNEEPIVISMDYVDWIKSELDLKLNGLKR